MHGFVFLFSLKINPSPFRYVQLNDRTYPLSLYLLTVAAWGDRKSAVEQRALQTTRDCERQQWTLYAEKLKAYRTATSIMAKSQTSKKPREAKNRERSKPVPPRLIIAEGGQLLGRSIMSKENLLKAITTLSTLWDGSSIDQSRSMVGESLRAYDRRLSLHLMLCSPTWPSKQAKALHRRPSEIERPLKGEPPFRTVHPASAPNAYVSLKT